MVKAVPVAAFDVSQAKFMLQLFVVALDAPTKLGDGNEFAEGDRCGQIRQPVSGGFLFRFRPFDQQPLLRIRFLASVVTVGRAHAQGGKP